MKKRVLLMSPTPPPIGGIATWTSSFVKNNIPDDIIILDTKKIIKRGKLPFFLLEIIRTIKILFKLNMHLLKDSVDIVHINSSFGNMGSIRDGLSLLISKFYKKFTIVHIHANADKELQTSKFFISIKKFILSKSDLVMVLNRTSLDSVKKFTNKAIKVPNFIEDKHVLEMKKNSENIKDICYLGRISKEKGIYEIFEIARKTPELNYNLIGPIEDKDIENEKPYNVKLYGPKNREEALEMITNFDLFLFLSHTEGFSIALLEAMARGLPVICTDVGANKEMVDDKLKGGVVVQNFNVDEVIQIISSLDVNTRVLYSNNNILNVTQKYTVSRVMLMINRIYNEIREGKIYEYIRNYPDI